MQEMKSTAIKIGNIILNPYDQNKLSAYVEIRSDEELTYSYRVAGKTADTDFTYTSDVPETELNIPVVGLYPDYRNEVAIYLSQNAQVIMTVVVYIDTSGQDYGDVPLSIEIERLDDQIASNTLDQGWVIDNLHNAYDKNGDLRLTGLYPWETNSLKIINNTIFGGGPNISSTLTNVIYRTNLMGKPIQQYTAPEGYVFHHDMTVDNSGHVYILGTEIEGPGDDHKREGIVYKYDMETGELLWSRDYTTEFMGSEILVNGSTNDIHFNTIEYEGRYNCIILNSRATSTIIGTDADSGDFLWTIDNPDNKVLDQELNFTPANQFVYPNGEHTTFPTTNPKYAEFHGENRIAISVFDNKSCLDAEQKDIVRPMEEDAGEYENYPFDSTGVILGINFEDKTVQQLDLFEFPSQRSEFVSSVYEIGEYYCAFFGAAHNFFVFDTDNKFGVRILGEENLPGLYRARIFTFEQLRTVVE